MILKHLCAASKGALSQYALVSSGASHRYFATSSSRANRGTAELTFLNDKYSTFSFKQIKNLSQILSQDLLKQYKTNDLKGQRIAVLCNNNYTYLVSLVAVWMANGVPLGLNKSYPPNLIEYFVNDAECKLVINGLESSAVNEKNAEFEAVLSKHGVVNYKLVENVFHTLKDENNGGNFSPKQELLALNEMRMLMKEQSKKDAVILYTSGTTGKPKGVVLTFDNVTSLAEVLIEAWQFSAQDCILHVLPLNHVHGLLYGLMTSFYNGSQVDMLPKFDANVVWSKLLDESNPINGFFGVPTVYVHLVNAYLNNPELQAKYPKEKVQQIIKNKMRLFACGSAPLNVKTYQEWTEITGYKLLDRYGMTEIGMGLSNPYDIEKRVAGTVGRPYGQTWVRIVDSKAPEGQDQHHVLIESSMLEDKFFKELDKSQEPIIGELQVKGSMVFKKYHNKPVQTKESFTDDGWFRTGDTAEFLRELKVYKLAGRSSVDIIKSGGYKISALDIEREVLAHPNVDDVAIIGLSDATWGQRIFALIVPKKSSSFSEQEFIKWCKQRLPKYQVPKQVKLIDKMPRNLLGKVNKKELVKQYEAEMDKTAK